MHTHAHSHSPLTAEPPATPPLPTYAGGMGQRHLFWLQQSIDNGNRASQHGRQRADLKPLSRATENELENADSLRRRPDSGRIALGLRAVNKDNHFHVKCTSVSQPEQFLMNFVN